MNALKPSTVDACTNCPPPSLTSLYMLLGDYNQLSAIAVQEVDSIRKDATEVNT